MRALRTVLACFYAFLGAGPSLWALALPGTPGVMACDRGACSCSVGAADRPEGKSCCCKMKAQLLKKFPALRNEAAACSISAQPCGANPEGVALQPIRPHLAVAAHLLAPGLGCGPLISQLYLRPNEALRSPPEAVPKG